MIGLDAYPLQVIDYIISSSFLNVKGFLCYNMYSNNPLFEGRKAPVAPFFS